MHLSTTSKDEDGDAFNTVFQYKIVHGPAKTSHYGECRCERADLGLELAKLAALPEDVLSTAKRIAYQLSELEDKGKHIPTLLTVGKQNDGAARVATRRRALLEVSPSPDTADYSSENDSRTSPTRRCPTPTSAKSSRGTSRIVLISS